MPPKHSSPERAQKALGSPRSKSFSIPAAASSSGPGNALSSGGSYLSPSPHHHQGSGGFDTDSEDEGGDKFPVFHGKKQESSAGVLDWKVSVDKAIPPPKNARARRVKNVLHVRNLVPTSLAVTAPMVRVNPRILPPIKGVKVGLSPVKKREDFYKPETEMRSPTSFDDVNYLHREYVAEAPSWLLRNQKEEEELALKQILKKEKSVMAIDRYELRMKEGLAALDKSMHESVDLVSMGSAVMLAHSRSCLPPVQKRAKTSFQ